MLPWVIGQLLTIFCTGLAIEDEISRERRIDCLPKPNTFQGECESKGCIWDNFYDKVKTILYTTNVNCFKLFDTCL
ncbi:unnamed protein product [Anisakis simplex]|uniref:P-type domain-containing protein n=1 Tax=Anisakis simplex TaxID=6269 RepID=A0A0M3J008_ANISI|nr:unnamed protein product [Anisakis simplex]